MVSINRRTKAVKERPKKVRHVATVVPFRLIFALQVLLKPYEHCSKAAYYNLIKTPTQAAPYHAYRGRRRVGLYNLSKTLLRWSFCLGS